MTADRNRETLLAFYPAFIRGDTDALRVLLADDFVSHAIPAQLGIGRDRQAALQFAQMHATAFPDLHVEVIDLIAEGDTVAARARMTGTHRGAFLGIPASGNAVEHEFVDVARCSGEGELVEIWNYADTHALLHQLGAVSQQS